jgi:hypothetical protein
MSSMSVIFIGVEMAKFLKSMGAFNYSNRSIGDGMFKYLGGSLSPYASGGYKFICDVRKDNAPREIRQVVGTILRAAVLKRAIFKIDSKATKDIFSSSILNPIDLSREVEWSLGYIANYEDQLVSYHILKDSLCKLYFDAKYSEMIKEIDTFQADFGYSLSLTEMKLFVSQKLGGLEMHKHVRDDIIKSSGKGFYSWYTSLISQRTEENVKFDSYRNRITNNLSRWPIDTKHKDFYNYRLNGFRGFDSDQFSSILLIHSAVSVYDLFDCLVDICGITGLELPIEIENIRSSLVSNDFTRHRNDLIDKLMQMDYLSDDARSVISKDLLFLQYFNGFGDLLYIYKYVSSDSILEWQWCSKLKENSDRSGANPENDELILTKLEIMSLLSDNNYFDAVRLSIEGCALNSNLLSIIPIVDLAKVVMNADIIDGKDLYKVMILDYYLRKIDDSGAREFYKYFFEDFLELNSFSKPSEMSIKDINVYGRQIMIEFYANACNYQNLSFLDSLKTSREVDKERINICSTLIDIDLNNSEKYREEITSIITRISVQDGIKIVDQSRIFVDTGAIKKWSENNILDSYIRLVSLLKPDSGLEDVDVIKSVILIMENQASMIRYLEVPKDEAEEILTSIVVDLKSKFLFDPEHGLNSFLSMRIRHGTLGGTLRGPAQEEGLINIKDKNGNYKINEAWSSTFTDPSEFSVIQNSINSFTSSIEDIIENGLLPLFYIRSEENKGGLIQLEISTSIVKALKLILSKRRESDFDDFFTTIMTTFNRILSEDLANISKTIKSNFADKLDDCFLSFIEQTKSISSPSGQIFRSSITQAMNNTKQAMNMIESWLSVADEHSIDTVFTLDQLVNIGLESALNITKGFRPEIRLKISEELKEINFGVSVVQQFSDIFYIVIDNCFKYSGKANPIIQIEFSEIAKSLNILFTCEMENEPTNEQIQTVANINQDIITDSYKDRIQGEGKSGIIKIKKILSANRQHSLSFGYNDGGFIVDISFPIKFIEGYNENITS